MLGYKRDGTYGLTDQGTGVLELHLLTGSKKVAEME